MCSKQTAWHVDVTWGFCKLWSILVSPCFAKTEEKTIKSQFGVNCRLHYDHYRQHCGLLHLRVSVCVFLCAMTAYSWPPFNRKLYIHTWSHVSLCKHPFHSSPTATMKKKKKKRRGGWWRGEEAAMLQRKASFPCRLWKAGAVKLSLNAVVLCGAWVNCAVSGSLVFLVSK